MKLVIRIDVMPSCIGWSMSLSICPIGRTPERSMEAFIFGIRAQHFDDKLFLTQLLGQ